MQSHSSAPRTGTAKRMRPRSRWEATPRSIIPVSPTIASCDMPDFVRSAILGLK